MNAFENYAMERVEEIIKDLETDSRVVDMENEIISSLPPETKKKYIEMEDFKNKQIRENYIKLFKASPNNYQ